MPGARVLLADDSPLAAAVARDVLLAAGYTVTVVSDGQKALDMLAVVPFDLLITDREMPVLDGLELARRVRRDLRTEKLYVLMLTGLGAKNSIVEGLEAGADDYLSKPFDAAELLARVHAGLRIVSLQGRLASANDRLAKLALTDALTDLPNRRAFDTLLDTRFAQTSRADGCSVAIADVDRFKAVNDLHGHATGDLVLIAVAGALRSAAPAGDGVARLGGEEFGLLLHGGDLRSAAMTCDLLRRAVARIRVPVEGGELSVTASFGVASMAAAQTPDEVLKRADAALYRAKNAGRDRVGIDALVTAA